jgi:hypothetical protein
VIFSAVGSLIWNTSSSFSLTPNTVGNFILFNTLQFSDNIVYATNVSSSNVAWSQLGTKSLGSVNSQTAVMWLGIVTSTSAATVTITWSGTAPANINNDGHEFSSNVAGTIILDQQGNLDSSGTNTWPPLTPPNNGDLYFGACLDQGTASAGSTSGYTYLIDTDNNGVAYNLNCAAGVATSPVWGDSMQQFGIVVLVTVAGGGPPTLPQPGSRTWRARYRRAQTPQWPLPPSSPPVTPVAPQPAPQPGSRTWRARYRRAQIQQGPLPPPVAGVPSPFYPPHSLLQGPPAATRSELYHVEAPPRLPPGPPAPFHLPRLLLRGALSAVAGKLSGLRGRPGVPAPFTVPHALLRGPAAARPGKLAGIVAPQQIRHLVAGGFPLRGPAAARPGKLAGIVAPPPVLHPVITSVFQVPKFPLRGPQSARKGTLAGIVAPPPVAQPNVPAPFTPPHSPLRGPVPATPRSKTTGAVAPPPAPPPVAPPHWQGSTHMIAATATGNLIQGANHTGRGGPGPDLKGDYERSGD